jgi:hypothetical protein
MMTDLSNESPMESETFDRGNPNRRCTAHKSDGSGERCRKWAILGGTTCERCRKWAILGGTTCATHGSGTKNAKRKARERLEAAADRMARELLGMATDTNVSESVRLAAIKDALSRAGISERTAIDVTHELKPWEQIYDTAAIEGGSRSDYRASVGRPDPDQPSAIENHHRPGGPRREASGVRVSGVTLDGHEVIEGELADDGDQDDRNHSPADHDADDDSQSRRETLANPVMPVRGYLPAEDAMEQAANTNRAYRHRMTRR